MAKQPHNSGKAWTGNDVRTIKDLAERNTPTRIIGLKMGRSEAAIRSKASDTGVTLKPTNQSPYNRRPK